MVNLSKMWQEHKVMPVITVDTFSGKVIMYAYMNKEAFAYTLKTHRAWYYDPGDGSVKKKGECSGNVQKVRSIKTDYDNKALLMYVEQVGQVSHHEGCQETYFINDIYSHENSDVAKRRKFGKLEIDEDFDYSKEDYHEEFEND